MARARPVWLPTLATVVFAALTATLGQWQWGKAELKAARQAGYDKGERLPVLNWKEVEAMGEAALYRRVRLRGYFDAEHQVLLDNRVQAGRAGYHVITPLRPEQGGAVLVNRGWHEAGADRSRLPRVAAPDGPQEVEGVLIHAQGRYLELAKGMNAGPVWQNLDMARYKAWLGGDSGTALSDFLIQQTTPSGEGLVRDWPKPDLGIPRHRSYAVQWFSLCALIVGLWGYFVLVKRGDA